MKRHALLFQITKVARTLVSPSGAARDYHSHPRHELECRQVGGVRESLLGLSFHRFAEPCRDGAVPVPEESAVEVLVAPTFSLADATGLVAR